MTDSRRNIREVLIIDYIGNFLEHAFFVIAAGRGDGANTLIQHRVVAVVDKLR